MKLDKDFSKAATEVLEILNYIEDEEFNKIDKTFIKMLEKCKEENYIFKINENDNFDSLVLNQKTNDLLAYIYRKYWATEEEKKEFDEQILKNDIDRQSEDDVINLNNNNNNTKLIEYENEVKSNLKNNNILKKILLWFKRKINK